MYISPTPNERLVLWRRRKRFTKKQAAQCFEVSEKKLKQWEKGKRFDNIPRIELQFVKPFERCYLIRIRSEITLKQLAATFGVTASIVSRWEHGFGSWDKLVSFYKEFGWKIDNEDYLYNL